MNFKTFYEATNISHTSTKSTSYQYAPESEENKKKRKNKLKKFTPYRGTYQMFNKKNTPVGKKGPSVSI